MRNQHARRRETTFDIESLVDRLEAVIREHVLAALPDPAREESADASLSHLLLTYGNWRTRFVAPGPREIHLSKELEAMERGVELEVLVSKIRSGEDLGPHLSRSVKYATDRTARNPANLSRRKDLDLMHAEWGVHHLHLSPEVEADGFTKRGDDLLFAAFRPEDAYLIGVYPHGSWVSKDVLAVIVRNWPDAGLLHSLNFVTGLTQEYSDEDRLKLRNSGITQPIQIDGRVYVPLGQTTAGTPISVTRNVDALIWTLRGWREIGEELLAEASGLVDKAAGRSITDAWLPTVHEDHCGLLRESYFVPIAKLF